MNATLLTFFTALGLLSLKFRGLVTTPAEWLEAQIDGYSSYIQRIESIVHEFMADRDVAQYCEDVFTHCATIFGHQLGYILDEAHLAARYARHMVHQ